jgi:glycylpeptide N-tetradecanoyltransferase
MSGQELQQHLQEVSDVVDKIVANGAGEQSGDNFAIIASGATLPTATADDTPSLELTLKQSQDTVDVKTLSDTQLTQFLLQKEYEKQLQRFERHEAKKKAAPKDHSDHKFWSTQPVLPMTEEVTEVNAPIDPNTDVSRVRQEPYKMPAGFEWCSMDVMDPVQIQELYNLLNGNYVEDDDCMFRFDYSIPFLQWALTPPGFLQDWHVGVRNAKTKVLMGCITAVPVDIRVLDVITPMAEINFLCVHKKLRTKRLAPVLIKEITRRVNVTGRWQAVYTAGVVLPKPVARCQYHHRSLNPKKLIEMRFSNLPPKTTMASHLKNFKLPKRPTHPLRAMTAEDVPQVTLLLQNYLATRTKLAQIFTEHDVAHIFLPRTGVVSTYVLDDVHGKVTDFCSFYYLPSTVIGNPLHNKLNAVYSYYNVAHTVPYEELIRDLLIIARDDGADVFNALDIMDNPTVFKNLLFGCGDGFLQYYLYNWKVATMPAAEVGLVLL